MIQVDEIEILGTLFDESGEGLSDVDILGDNAFLGSPNFDYTIGSDGVVELGSFLDDVGSFVKKAASSVASVGKAIVKSPITKTIAGAAAIAFPAVGVPLSAGLVIADRAVRTAEGARGNPAQQAVMKKAITNTTILAKKGDPDAKRAIEFMAATRRIRATAAKQTHRQTPIKGTLVRRDGTIVRGNWVGT